ncbi:small integral membrane protein 23 [Artibeus jamaicensis]|uniref:small integral membrane protein 23 n=1 Tax=Artibeus jamaicensis TaxID=9417 RepID=UPI00235AD1FD|nr:small integral membrane protein 23 [Artibeus jamaicensis]
MAPQQVGSWGRVAAEPFEPRGGRCEDKKQTLLALLILVLYMGAGISGRSWEVSERIRECSCPPNPVASQGFECQTSGPTKEPIRVLRTWLKESVQVFLEKLETEVCKLEQLDPDWLLVLQGHLPFSRPSNFYGPCDSVPRPNCGEWVGWDGPTSLTGAS